MHVYIVDSDGPATASIEPLKLYNFASFRSQVWRFMAWTQSASMPAILVAMRSFLAAEKVHESPSKQRRYKIGMSWIESQ